MDIRENIMFSTEGDLDISATLGNNDFGCVNDLLKTPHPSTCTMGATDELMCMGLCL